MRSAGARASPASPSPSSPEGPDGQAAAQGHQAIVRAARRRRPAARPPPAACRRAVVGVPSAGTARGKQGSVGAGARSSGPKRGLGGDQVEGRQAVRELLLAGRRKVREIWLLAEQDQADVLDDIVELAEAERVPVRQVSRGQVLRRGALRGAAGRAGQGGAARGGRSSTTSPRLAPAAARRSSSPSTASPTPATSARCCARPSAPAPPGSSCPATAPCTSPRRSPRRRPGPSSTCRSRSSAACPPRCSSCRKHGVWVVGLDGGGDHRAVGPARRRRADRAGARRRGDRACRGSSGSAATPSPASRSRGARLAERRRGGGAGLLRGGPRPRRGLVRLLPTGLVHRTLSRAGSAGLGRVRQCACHIVGHGEGVTIDTGGQGMVQPD